MTDADGRYTVDFVPAGTFRVEVADAATGDRGRATNQVSANGEVRTINVTLNGTGRVVVTVRDSANNLVPGAQVRVTSETQFGGAQTAATQRRRDRPVYEPQRLGDGHGRGGRDRQRRRPVAARGHDSGPRLRR